MIVKNEAHVIRRCLDSVRPLIDHWFIVDTGSSDGTQAIIREHLKDLPGELIERPWVNFAHNRSEALAYARGKGDYVLIMDADDTLEIAKDFELPRLTADAYTIEIFYAGMAYSRRQLIKNTLPWRYESVIHEYLTCEDAKTEALLPGLRIVPHHDGARARDPETYRKDAAILEQVLRDEPNNTRYAFYLAQSYRDAGDLERALASYRQRAEMQGWDEEIWHSYYQIAKLQERLKRPWGEVTQSYLAAYQYKADRAEPLYHLGMHYQHQQQYAIAHLYFTRAMQIPQPPSSRLFVESNIYRQLLPIEYAVACYYVGDHAEAIRVNERLLEDKSLPQNLVELVTKNRQFSLNALGWTGTPILVRG